MLKDAQKSLMSDSGNLRSPKQKRDELLEIKTKLEEFNCIKTQHNFFGKRDRIFKGGWRHGIFGVEDADQSKNNSIFYQEQHLQKVHEQ